MGTIERMYIEFLELENDDLVQSLINQKQTISRHNEEITLLINKKADIERENTSLSRHTIQYREHIAKQNIRIEELETSMKQLLGSVGSEVTEMLMKLNNNNQ
jgi:hypothetical protein